MINEVIPPLVFAVALLIGYGTGRAMKLVLATFEVQRKRDMAVLWTFRFPWIER